MSGISRPKVDGLVSQDHSAEIMAIRSSNCRGRWLSRFEDGGTRSRDGKVKAPGTLGAAQFQPVAVRQLARPSHKPAVHCHVVIRRTGRESITAPVAEQEGVTAM